MKFKKMRQYIYNYSPDDENDEYEEENKSEYEGPGGGAFSSWSDFWKYKEG